ncbi:hypothetical protein MTO96_049164 [Rhipicephalus appendiculatus]
MFLGGSLAPTVIGSSTGRRARPVKRFRRVSVVSAPYARCHVDGRDVGRELGGGLLQQSQQPHRAFPDTRRKIQRRVYIFISPVVVLLLAVRNNAGAILCPPPRLLPYSVAPLFPTLAAATAD